MHQQAVEKILEKHYMSHNGLRCVDCGNIIDDYSAEHFYSRYVQNSLGQKCQNCGQWYLITAFISDGVIIYKKADFHMINPDGE
jgi:uncharacterized protein with PIN domain